jgi:hypothetical protein
MRQRGEGMAHSEFRNFGFRELGIKKFTIPQSLNSLIL